MKKALVIGLTLLVCACTYSVYMTRYPHLKTIRVSTFENRSTQYAVQEEILDALAGDFQKDGQLKVVELAPDCVLEGVVLDYQNDIYDYNAQDVVTQYRVKMLFSITLTDLVKNEEIWKNDALLLEQTWSEQSTSVDIPNTEEKAREEIYGDLYDKIKESTFESW